MIQRSDGYDRPATHHDREHECCIRRLDDPEYDEAGELNKREDVDSLQSDLTQIDIVRLMLRWHKKQHHPVHKLKQKNDNQKCTTYKNVVLLVNTNVNAKQNSWRQHVILYMVKQINLCITHKYPKTAIFASSNWLHPSMTWTILI